MPDDLAGLADEIRAHLARRRRHSTDLGCEGGWFRCIRCHRFFTKRVDALFCYDCRMEMPNA